MAQSKQPEPSKRSYAVRTHLAPLVIIVTIGMGFLAGYWVLTRSQEVQPDPEQQTGVTKPLRYLRLLPLTGDGQPVSLDDLAGRVVLLNYWGTWCRYCRDELQPLAELRKRYAGQKAFLLLAVSCPPGLGAEDVESLREETADLLDRLHVDLPTYYDPHLTTLSGLQDLIDFQGSPTTLLLDRRGVIRAVWVGYRPGLETEMERYIGTILDEGKEPSEKRPGDL